jgi:hypothetical protein
MGPTPLERISPRLGTVNRDALGAGPSLGLRLFSGDLFILEGGL